MPAKPSYCRNLPQAIVRLGSLEAEWVGRRELEVALEVSKSVAWRLLRHCGAQPGPGQALMCRRADLIARLEELMASGGTVDYEVRRRQRLAGYLERIRPQVIAARTVVAPAGAAPALFSSRLASLPSNVSLTPGHLHVRFDGAAEFLAAIGAIVYALSNDWEAISDALGPPAA